MTATRSLPLIGALTAVLALASPAVANIPRDQVPSGAEVTEVEGPFSVVLDPKLEVDGSDRPVSAIAGPDTAPGTFVTGEAVVSGGRDAAERFASSVDGKLADTIDTTRLEGVAPLWLVRFDPAGVNPKTLERDLAALSPDEAHGVRAVSDKAGLQTLAAAARARMEDLDVGLDWLSAGHTFRTRTTTDAPGTFPGDSRVRMSSLAAIQVPGAWNTLARAGRFAAGAYRPRLAVIDNGFSPPDADRAPGGVNAPSLPNPTPARAGRRARTTARTSRA